MSAFEFVIRLTLGLGLIWFILFFLILIHELSHTIACNYLKIKVEKISIGWPIFYCATNKQGLASEYGIFPVFGYTLIPDLNFISLRKRAIIAGIGPIASFLLGFILLGIDYLHPLWLVSIAGHASLSLGAINLIPLPPFDGWPVLRHFLSKAGIEVSEYQQNMLMAAGIALIGLSVLFIEKFGGL